MLRLKPERRSKPSTITNSAADRLFSGRYSEIAISIYIEQGSASKKMVSRVIQAYEKTKTMQPEYPQTVQTLLP